MREADVTEEPYATDRESLERDTEVAFFVAGGPGGQHRNKVATGVRLTHRPSGIVLTATERRSQAANREVAFARLAARLMALNTPAAPRIATKVGRAQRSQRRSDKHRRAQTKQLRRGPSDRERES